MIWRLCRDGLRDSLSVLVQGQLDSETNYHYDDRGRVTRIGQLAWAGAQQFDKTVTIAYGPNDRIESLRRFASSLEQQEVVRTTYEYDQQDRLLHLSHVQTSPFSILAAYSYQYDALGRISYLTSNDGTTEYSYDAAGQLASADYNFANTSTEPGDESFSFDANGNANGAAFTPGDFNRPESDGAWTYEYDEEGNRTAKISTVDADERFEYAWDARNRLIEVWAYDAEGLVTQVTTHAYDHLNRWVRTENSPATGPAEVRRFVYDGDQIILALDGNEQPTARYLWGPAVDLLLAEDHLGAAPGQVWAGFTV